MPALNDVPQNRVTAIVEQALLAGATEITVTKQDDDLYTVAWNS